MNIERSVSGGICEIAFARPPVNALGGDDMLALADALSAAGREESVRVVILHGAGRGYCAGIDVKALATDPGSISHLNRSAFDLFSAIHHCPVPVISAAHGFALGAGAAMLGASDILFLAENTRVGLPEIKVGMLGGASHLLRLLPLARVRSMYFTGEPIEAAEMYRLGAVEAVVPPERLLETARQFAARIAVHPATGLRFAKEAMNGIEPVRLERNYRYEQGFTFEISHLREGRAAREAFVSGPADRSRRP